VSQLSEGQPSEIRIGWHPVDVVSLVAGLVALAVAVLSLVDVSLGGGEVVVPVLLLVGGALGLAASLRRGRDADRS
jgi:hypothetical protein